MTASFKAPLFSKGNVITAITLLSLIAWHFPGISTAYAKTAGNTKETLVFEIKSSTELTQNQKTAEQLAQAAAFAKIDKKVALVRAYLQSKNSPLENYTEILLAQDDWAKIIAISNSESNMGLHCYRQYNCSGIFTTNGLKVYNSMPEWIVDMQHVIDKRYKGQSLKQMNGVYVQPASANWLKASTTIYDDLTLIDRKVEEAETVEAAAPQNVSVTKSI